MRVVAAVSHPRDVQHVVRAHPVDIAVLAVGAGQPEFLEEAVDLLNARAELRLVAVAEVEDPALLARAVRMGFRGWVPKNVGVAALITALQEVRQGGTVIPPLSLTGLLAHLLDEERQQWEAARPLAALTPRERQVLTAMCRGASRQRIAADLAISPNTVRTHVQSVLRKLDVHSSLAAVTLARRARFG
ncbi:DNA-binding response regulator, NarL/FixJ family, contains REC and HTH domains [Geodermatophilus telluris]|uniref:DNA-binding response regulator, NarL/FixJ family, contains REC and HTH domains n=1 Tax=Geodermatophilus telluris TaxID=1190417 RepID=A0A1G6L4X5_9ACTN|nr:response regulator transcription factor [Geodermatophilus telluris]SDC38340.1 DNA-binding response regulator, NarL/FixJ family, contains REC and HTH domains [Geodermatophilus telluris]